MCPAKTQISLGIHPVWSVFAVRFMGSLGPKLFSGGQGRLWSDWAKCPGWTDLSLRWADRSFCWFCHEVAHLHFPKKGLLTSLSLFLFSTAGSFSLFSFSKKWALPSTVLPPNLHRVKGMEASRNSWTFQKSIFPVEQIRRVFDDYSRIIFINSP